jgi:hypothetical protein
MLRYLLLAKLMFRSLIDFIHANPWPVFGFTVAVVAMVLSEFFGAKGDGSFPDLDLGD